MKVYYYIATFIRSFPSFEGVIEDLKQHIEWYKKQNLPILYHKTYKRASKRLKNILWDDWTYDICKIYFNKQKDCIVEYKELDSQIKYYNFKKDITPTMLKRLN